MAIVEFDGAAAGTVNVNVCVLSVCPGVTSRTTVVDTEPPTITCPSHQFVPAETGRCDAVVSFTPAFSEP